MLIDAHTCTHTFVAVDEFGRKVGQLTDKAAADGDVSAIECAAPMAAGQCALEDGRHVPRRLQADLLAAVARWVRVRTERMTVRRGGA